jgi:hypothetical protein
MLEFLCILREFNEAQHRAYNSSKHRTLLLCSMYITLLVFFNTEKGPFQPRKSPACYPIGAQLLSAVVGMNLGTGASGASIGEGLASGA